MDTASVGTTLDARLDIEEPIADLHAPDRIERLHGTVFLQEERIGALVLPVFDGLIPAYVLSDALANEFAWDILDRFFQRTIYSELELKRTPGGLEAWRGDVCLARGLPDSPDPLKDHLHDLAGWTLFLQEFWGRPNEPLDWFYDPQAVEAGAPACQVDDGWLALDAGEPVPDVVCSTRPLHIQFGVAGVAIGVVTLPVEGPPIPAHALRIALTHAAGFELCRAAVREALLGRAFQGGISLHARLVEGCRREAQPLPLVGSVDKPDRLEFAQGWPGVIRRAVSAYGAAAILPRRSAAEIDTSLSRRAVFPASVYADLVQTAGEGGALIHVNSPHGRPVPTIYAPDLILRSPPHAGKQYPPVGGGLPGIRHDGEGCEPLPGAPVAPAVTDRLPILMYHRVAPSGSPALAPYRIAPERFEEQLRYLRDGGYYGVSLEDWQAAMQEHAPLPGRAVLLTFDDGYRDFKENAWPLLQQYGFSALVFLVAAEIGGFNRWDQAFGEEIPLLSWDEIRKLSAAGVRFGSHSYSHPNLAEVSPEEVARQALRSRLILESGLEMPVRAFSYPHGGEDSLVRHIVGACGYIFGLTTRPGRSGLWDPLLALPRINVKGDAQFDEFVRQVS